MRFHDRIYVPDVPELNKSILEEGHKSSLSINLSASKMYQDFMKMFWWLGIKKDIGELVYVCLTYQKSKIEHQNPSGLMQPLIIPEWK